MDIRFILAIVIALIVAPIALAIGAVITFEVTGSIDTDENSHAENAIADIESNTATGFALGSLLPLVIAAVGLISVIVIGFVGLYGRAGPGGRR